MERLKLEVESREVAGKRLKKLRNAGYVPAVIYGKKKEPKIVQVNVKALQNVTETEAGLNAIFDLAIDGKEEGLVRICDFQAHPIQRNFVHVDFQTIDLSEKVDVEVPVKFTGKSEGVKMGGVLDIHRRKLELRCLVTSIPSHIEIDISALNIGDNIHADELQLPEGVEFPHDKNFTVVAVVPPQKEEEVVPVVAAGEVPVVGAEGAAAEGVAKEGEGSAAAKKEEKK